LFYTIFPTFLNIPHLLFAGGNVAEPVIALSHMGITPKLSIAAIILLSVLQVLFLCKLFNDHAKITTTKKLTSTVVKI
jgi:hypothetical protein